ncbi:MULTISPECIES: TetR/AcrR family transcriptional regulator [Roseobacteraceae]|uniref:TetR/AcrR family transcriptional regulator n=1 Tax=Roseobacteraceae TaxID=2854170 RepID=UPI00262866A8|nr:MULTISPECIES: TetR/AcrR family transcriptional regulator [Roseobacteraceae]
MEINMGRMSKRETILDTAEALFSTQGFAATGINQITRDAGVASMTLYNNFDSKDDLIIAALIRRSEQLLADIQAAANQGCDAHTSILAVFDAIEHWVKTQLKSSAGFTGCLFLKAAHEHPDLSSNARRIAVRHKEAIISMFRRYLDDLGADDSSEMALSLHLLIDGAISQAQLFSDAKSVRRARNLANILLNAID